MALHWLDPVSAAGAVVAFGTFPNREVGLTWVAGNVGGTDVARSMNDLQLVSDDRRTARLGAGGVHFSRLGEGRGSLTIEAGPVSASVEFLDLYPESSWLAGSSAELDQLAHGHIEASSLVTGSLTVDGRRVEFESALGHRDHSWGPRRLEVCRNHRWLAGTCGASLSFSLDNLVTIDGRLSTFGFVVMDGSVQRLAGAEIVVGLAPDCLTPRNVSASVLTDAGVSLDFEALPALPTFYNERLFLDRPGVFVATDTLMQVRVGDLHGIANLNLTVNPLGGIEPPVVLA